MITLVVGVLLGMSFRSDHVKPVMTAQVPEHKFVICVDPGHPTYYSSGRKVQHGTTELNVNWQVASDLVDTLSENPDLQVIKTREVRDALMTNPERATIANDVHADLLLRLHCDAGPSSGFTVYFPNKQGTDLGKTGPAMSVISSSRHAAFMVHLGMLDVLRGSLRDRGVRGESKTKVGRKQGVLTGSIFCEVPVVTVEMVFLSNRHDADFIKSREGRKKMVQALAQGVEDYVKYLQRTDKSNQATSAVKLVRPGEIGGS